MDKEDLIGELRLQVALLEREIEKLREAAAERDLALLEVHRRFESLERRLQMLSEARNTGAASSQPGPHDNLPDGFLETHPEFFGRGG
jgi:uncharacterized coiled-coil protein SlyX